MSKIKQHPNDPTMYMYWDIAIDSPEAFWVAPSNYNNASWTWNEDYDCPTVSPSILSTSSCHVLQDGTRIEPYRNHIFIKNGKIEYLPDCTHALAGQIVDMVEFPEDLF